jgi:hypothetical protein
MQYVIQKIEIDANNNTVYLQDAFMANTADGNEVAKLADAVWGRDGYMGFVIKQATNLN